MNAAPSSPHWVSGKGTSLQNDQSPNENQRELDGWGGNSPVIIMVQPLQFPPAFPKISNVYSCFLAKGLYLPLLAWFTNICWVLFLHRGPVDREEMDNPWLLQIQVQGTVLEATICWVSVCQALLCLSHITTFDSNTKNGSLCAQPLFLQTVNSEKIHQPLITSSSSLPSHASPPSCLTAPQWPCFKSLILPCCLLPL